MFEKLLDPLIPVLSLTIALILLVIVVRGASAAWVRLRRHRVVPVIVHAGPPAGAAEGEADREAVTRLQAGLRTFIAEDVQQHRALVPGGSSVVTPTIPAETPKYDASWTSAVQRLARSEGPGYHLYPVVAKAADGWRCSVEIVRRPGNGILSARTFAAADIDDLVVEVGSFCVQTIQQQKRLLVQTPRWEHWATRGGYRVFRRALAAELSGDHAAGRAGYEAAGRLSIGNVTVTQRLASLEEQEGDYPAAIRHYELCHRLWPEHVETRYRLAAAHNNSRLPGSAAQARAHFLEIARMLRRRTLWLRWLRTWRISRRNTGERQYWRSWLRRRDRASGSRRSKRADFLHATRIAATVAGLNNWLERAGAGRPAPAAEVAAMIDEVRGALRRGRLGWLAHYNASCLFSLLIAVPQEGRPAGAVGDWAGEWARHAAGELGVVIRDPVNRVDPTWMSIDPDLAHLRADPEQGPWCTYLGVSVQV